MEEWLTGLAAATLIPAIAALAKALIAKALESKTKDVVTIDQDGRTETVVVKATAGPSEIRDRVNEAYAFESVIGNVLTKLQEKNSLLRMHTSRQVDFIVEMPNGKIALEAKLSLRRIDAKAMDRYFTAEADLRHLLLVSRDEPTQSLRDAISAHFDAGRVSFVTVPDGVDPAPLVENAVKRISTDPSGA